MKEMLNVISSSRVKDLGKLISFFQSKRDLITGLKTRTNAGRPNWDKVFKQMSEQRKGKVRN